MTFEWYGNDDDVFPHGHDNARALPGRGPLQPVALVTGFPGIVGRWNLVQVSVCKKCHVGRYLSRAAVTNRVHWEKAGKLEQRMGSVLMHFEVQHFKVRVSNLKIMVFKGSKRYAEL